MEKYFEYKINVLTFKKTQFSHLPETKIIMGISIITIIIKIINIKYILEIVRKAGNCI